MTERSDLFERAATAYRVLADLAETVEDEWEYVTDIAEAYLPEIGALGGRTGALGLGAVVAIDEAIAEIGAITAPHKAIDWLSTFPHVVALAAGGDVDGTGRTAGAANLTAATGALPAVDEDSPFRILRGDR